jgi:rhamnose transport system permease protein
MLRSHRIEVSTALALTALGMLLAVRAPAFFQPGHLLDVLLALLPVLAVAVGTTLVILSGEIDISVGSVFGVCSVAAGVMAVSGVPLPLVLVLTPLVGAALGAVNGTLVAWLSLPSIVVTLAALVAWRDGLRWVTQGAWVQNLPANFQWLGLSQAGYPPAAIGTAVAVLVAAGWALGQWPAGRAVYATGSNAEAARLAGIDTRRVRLWTFTIAGACTGLGALLNAARFNQIPANTGVGLEMQVIAAVVVGGTAITGGRGTIVGTTLGVALLGTMGPALTFLGVSAFWERALQGAIILVAVGSDALRARRRISIPRGAVRTEQAGA